MAWSLPLNPVSGILSLKTYGPLPGNNANDDLIIEQFSRISMTIKKILLILLIFLIFLPLWGPLFFHSAVSLFPTISASFLEQCFSACHCHFQAIHVVTIIKSWLPVYNDHCWLRGHQLDVQHKEKHQLVPQHFSKRNYSREIKDMPVAVGEGQFTPKRPTTIQRRATHFTSTLLLLSVLTMTSAFSKL